ncbi:MAG TPA: SulP family inorganic anion transporter, partial [Paracoccaceae bacterium]|nr:SulP family inorganic anion transporter [Paracoccaceae bacterium]
MRRYFPILSWAPGYDRAMLGADLLAAVIVTIMLIPQSLAYAMLAGLPPETGLYASMAPLVLYALFGTSRTLAVGPVAVASLMTAATVGKLAEAGTPEYLGAAIALAVISGLMLLAMGLARLGFLANFLSHPVISGFITASAVLIAAGQVPALLGISARGENLPELLHATYGNIDRISLITLAIGGGALASLWAMRRWLAGGLE